MIALPRGLAIFFISKPARLISDFDSMADSEEMMIAPTVFLRRGAWMIEPDLIFFGLQYESVFKPVPRVIGMAFMRYILKVSNRKKKVSRYTRTTKVKKKRKRYPRGVRRLRPTGAVHSLALADSGSMSLADAMHPHLLAEWLVFGRPSRVCSPP